MRYGTKQNIIKSYKPVAKTITNLYRKYCITFYVKVQYYMLN